MRKSNLRSSGKTDVNVLHYSHNDDNRLQFHQFIKIPNCYNKDPSSDEKRLNRKSDRPLKDATPQDTSAAESMRISSLVNICGFNSGRAIVVCQPYETVGWG